MAKSKEETVITQLRIPKHLHHKITLLSESDDRSFNSYIIKILQESVAEFEQNLLDSFGIVEFTELYLKMFGSEYLPYIKHEYVEFEPEQIKVIAQKIMRGSQRTPYKITKENINKEVIDVDKLIKNVDKNSNKPPE